jgi:hypothetical protein
VQLSAALASGTNQLLNFELRGNGVKYSVASVKVLFTDNTQYQTVTLKKLVSLNTDDLITV